MTDFLLGAAETIAWCLLVAVVAGGIGWACAEIRFSRRKK